VFQYSSASEGGGRTLIMSISPISRSSRDNTPEGVEFQLPGLYRVHEHQRTKQASLCGRSIAKKWILRSNPAISASASPKLYLRMARIVPQWHKHLAQPLRRAHSPLRW
jgi:hypothetical protein